MKYFLLITCFLFISFSVDAQSISKQVIGSSGVQLTNGTHIINFTVGETIVGKIENGNTIHQGFWAELNSDETLSLETLVESTNTISLFPNPVVNVLQIKYKNQNAEDFSVHLYDVNGRQIFNLKPVIQDQITQVNISHLSQGMYMLVVIGKKYNYNKSFKIIKS